MAQNTTDDDTLASLLRLGMEGDRSVLAALFHRGYTEGRAISLYASNRLVTVGNFKKLSDEVLEKYVRAFAEDTWGPWRDWSEKFSGKTRMQYLWESILPGRDALCVSFVKDPPGDRYQANHEALYRVAADECSPSVWDPEQIKKIWTYATDSTRLVHLLDKPTRIELFGQLGRKTRKTRGAEATWLFDCTRSDVEPLFKQNKLTSKRFIAHVFGRLWGEIVKVSQGDGWKGLPFRTLKDFFASLTREDVLLLHESPVRSSFTSSVTSLGASRRHPGGHEGWLEELWGVCPGHVRIWLVGILRPRFTRDLVARDPDPDLQARYAQMQDAQDTSQRDAAEKFLDGRSPDRLNGRNLARYLKFFTPAEAADIYVGLREDNATVDFDQSEKYLAREVPVNRSVAFLRWLPRMSGYGRDEKAAEVLSRFPASQASELLAVDNEVVQAWAVRNLQAGLVVGLLGQHPWLLSKVCDIQGQITQPDLEALISAVADAGMAAEEEAASLACLVKQLDNPSSYLQHPAGVVRSAALTKAPVADAVQAILDEDEPIIAHLFARPDFGEVGPDLIRAHFQNSEVSEPDGIAPRKWRRSLTGFDSAVPRMSDAQFKANVVAMLEVADHRSMRRAAPFGMNTQWRLLTVSLTEADLEGTGRSMRSAMDTLTNSKHAKVADLGTVSLTDLVVLYPWDVVWAHHDVQTKVVGAVLQAYCSQPSWLAGQTVELLEELEPVVSGHRHTEWGTERKVGEELKTRRAATRELARGQLDASLQQAVEAGEPSLFAGVVAGTFTTNEGVAFEVLRTTIRSRDLTPGFKASVIGHLPPGVLDRMWESRDMDLRLGVAQYSSPVEFGTRLPSMIEELAKKNGNTPEFYKRDTRLKAAMVARATNEEALELFKYYYKVQGRFGPKVREAFLERLDSGAFADMLAGFLLSKAFNLRKKQFTIEMVPLVIKLDNAEVTAKFNASSRFRAQKIGRAVDHWDRLPDDAAKQKWLDDVSDKTIMERLLRDLVERTISLRAPLDEEFEIGTNNAVAVAPLLSQIQQTSRTITHSELFNLAVERSSEAELREMLLTNPLKVFDFRRSAADRVHTVRLDTVPAAESARITRVLEDNWTGARRAIRPNVKGVFKVTNPNQGKWEKRKNPSRNVMTLFHGTHFFVAGLIIQNHFKVMRSAKAGRMMGDGIYFTDVGSKCAQYITTNAPSRYTAEGVVLVCEVDLGNMLELNSGNDHLRHNKWQPLGYDSIFWPKKSGTGYGGRDSEYAVADVTRIRVTHAIYLERVNDSAW